jgi:hypothetical protein
MKKLILIVLIVCFVVSIGIVALAELKFGDWDKWDEELPPAENQSWYWAIPDLNEPRELFLKGWGNDGSDIILLFSDIYFYGDKKGKTKISILFYSLGNMNKKDWDIPNANLALAAFPPKKGKIIIRAYKMNEDKIFQFFEEWTIPFKDHEIAIPEDVQFRREFKMWVQSQIYSHEWILPEHIEDMMGFIWPELSVRKKIFLIINGQPKTK